MIPIYSKKLQEILGTCCIETHYARKNGKTQQYDEMMDKITKVLD